MPKESIQRHPYSNLSMGRGNRFASEITTNLSTISQIDAVRVSQPPIIHIAGVRYMGIAPGDGFACVLCGLCYASGTAFDNHKKLCTGCPNPNRFAGDGVRFQAIEKITKFLGKKDHQRDNGRTYNHYADTEDIVINQLSSGERTKAAKLIFLDAEMHINAWRPGNQAAMQYTVPNPNKQVLAQLSRLNGTPEPKHPLINPYSTESSYQQATGSPPMPPAESSQLKKNNSSPTLSFSFEEEGKDSEEDGRKLPAKEDTPCTRSTHVPPSIPELDSVPFAAKAGTSHGDSVEVVSPTNQPKAKIGKMVSLRLAREMEMHHLIHDRKGTNLKNLAVITCSLDCRLCTPNGALTVEDCQSSHLENHLVKTNAWWTTTFVWDFAIFIHHHFHKLCGESNIHIHRQPLLEKFNDKKSDRTASLPIPEGKDWMISIMHTKNHTKKRSR